jgi:molybdopterin-guanine dinucleotide biosynthesis protein A
MLESIDTIIVCGGKGTRMRELTDNYKCKSLVPILGIPIMSYLTHSIRKAVPNSRIILAIDNHKLKNEFERLYNKQEITNYQIYEGLPRGPVQAFYESGSLCRTKRVLIFFGNQLVSSDHIKKMLKQDKKTLVMTGFTLLSENNCKVARLDKSNRVWDVTRYNCRKALKKSEVYLDVPYVVPNNFFSMETFPEIKRLFVKTPLKKTPLNREEIVTIVKSEFPAEFHFKNEIGNLEELTEVYFKEFIRKFRGRF